uniref:Uncharacterized protein n=1 Tax=Anopheles melas TaxID=34690 RepID=A0A182TZA2_9DIPT
MPTHSDLHSLGSPVVDLAAPAAPPVVPLPDGNLLAVVMVVVVLVGCPGTERRRHKDEQCQKPRASNLHLLVVPHFARPAWTGCQELSLACLQQQQQLPQFKYKT